MKISNFSMSALIVLAVLLVNAAYQSMKTEKTGLTHDMINRSEAIELAPAVIADTATDVSTDDITEIAPVATAQNHESMADEFDIMGEEQKKKERSAMMEESEDEQAEDLADQESDDME